MKRWTIIVLTLIMMISLMAVEALAYFEDTSLVLVVYNENDYELGIDLGNVNEINFAAQDSRLAPAGTVSLSRFSSAITQWAQLNAGIFTATQDWQHGFFGITLKSSPGIIENNFVAFQSAAHMINNNEYSVKSEGNSTVTIQASVNNSYDTKMNSSSNSPGSYISYPAYSHYTPEVEANLAALSSEGYVDIYLYHYKLVNNLDKGHNDATDYVAVVRIKDDGSVWLNPPVVNQPPTNVNANASSSAVVEGESVTLYGSAEDADGDTLTYTWSTTDSVSGFPKDGAQVTFDAPAVDAATDLTFTLSVSDGVNTAVTDTVTVTVNDSGAGNTAPTNVSAAADPNPAVEGATVTLSASAEDADGDTLTYSWSTNDSVSGFPKDGAQVTFDAPAVDAATDLTFTLSVSDGVNAAVTDTVTVTVNDSGAGNTAPTNVSAAADPNPAVEGATVTLSASAEDADGDTLTYSWSTDDSVSGFPKDGAQVTFDAPAVDAATDLTFTLSVSDGVNTAVTDTVTVTVNAESTDPVADAGAAQQVSPGASVTLDGSASSDPDGDITAYSWQQSPQDTVTVTIVDDDPADGLATFQVPEDAPAALLTFTLTVTDNDGKTDSNSCHVKIVPDDYTPPSANAGPDQTVWEYASVTLDGSGSTYDASTQIQWQQSGGPVNVTLTGDTTLSPSFIAPEVPDTTGDLVFELVLTDPNTEDSSKSAVTITVKKNLPPNTPSSSLTPTDENGVWEATELTPTLAVNNSEDTEGDALTYEFEIYDAGAVDPENLVFAADQILEGENTSTWRTPLLEENTFYYWRARANDGLQSGKWMELSTIFVNAQEEAPTAPTVSFPAAGTSVGAKPKLEITNSQDPDLDALTYEFRLYTAMTDPIYSPYLQKTEQPQGSEGTSEWTVDTPLEENTFYWWRARATDDTGLSSEWTEPSMFLVDENNDPPEPPTINYPLDTAEIDTLEPIFEIAETIDPEGDPIVYYIEVDIQNTFDSESLIQSEAIEVISATTQWTVPTALAENTTYYYRVKASDGEAESEWSVGSFFVNQLNEAPSQPVHVSPEPENPEDENPKITIVNTLAPTLVATEAVDPDKDALTYEFELFDAGNLTESIAGATGNEQPSWEVPAANLANGKKYAWHVRAVDEHGEAGEWSTFSHFIVGANYYQPSTPEQVNPFNGGTVNSLTPVLSVVAQEDGDGNDIWIEFELYRDRDLTDLVSFSLVAIGATATSWQVDATLEDLSDYFWRARATDKEKYSSWTTVAGFTVDVNAQVTSEIRVWQVANYDPNYPWYTVMEVDDEESNIFGVKVVIPPGALSSQETLFIGEATGVQSLDNGMVPLGCVVQFGPSGTQFNVAVSIHIPYTDDDLENAGGITPEELQVYRFDETNQVWESISVTQVDADNKMLVCEVDHFSLYTIAMEGDGINPADQSGSGGGGGGGSCFIGTFGLTSSSATGRTFGMGLAVAVMMACGLIVTRRDICKKGNAEK